MIYIKPSFFDEFRCIASRCTDNCCIGWEIDIDDESMEKYNSLTGSFGDELRSKIQKSSDGSNCFVLGEGGRCSFLDENNLCRIISEKGEGFICDICREHPRFYNCFPGVYECGLGLCCEEVCRIIVEEEDSISLVEENDGEKITLDDKQDIADSDSYIYLSAFREVLFTILSDEGKTFQEKIVGILTETEKFTGEKIKIRNIKEILELYRETEPIDNEWIQYITLLSDFAEGKDAGEIISNTRKNSLYSRILSYLLYRHFINCVYDGQVKNRVCFCVEAIVFIMLSDIMSEDNIINNVKRWSKQVEYSEENTELLIYGE